MNYSIRLSFLLLSFLAFIIQACAQSVPADKPQTLNPKFDEKITSLLSFDVPLISVEELKQKQSQVLLFDAREKEEFDVSHIKGAQYIGYNKFDASILKDIPKDKEIVLYCSIGYRSEKIGEKLQKMGFTNVSNLYGSIFEWVNQDNPVVNKNGQTTKTVHGYNKNWSQWVDSKTVEKIW